MTEHSGHWSEVKILRIKWPEGEGHFGPRFAVVNQRTGEIHDAFSALGAGVLTAEIIAENDAFRRTYGDGGNDKRATGCFEEAVGKGKAAGRDRKQSADGSGEDVPPVPPGVQAGVQE